MTEDNKEATVEVVEGQHEGNLADVARERDVRMMHARRTGELT